MDTVPWEPEPLAQRDRFVLEVETTARSGPEALAGLKRWLKVGLRAYHVRVTGIRRAPEIEVPNRRVDGEVAA